MTDIIAYRERIKCCTVKHIYTEPAYYELPHTMKYSKTWLQWTCLLSILTLKDKEVITVQHGYNEHP
jgi:hypothetical protein